MSEENLWYAWSILNGAAEKLEILKVSGELLARVTKAVIAIDQALDCFYFNEDGIWVDNTE